MSLGLRHAIWWVGALCALGLAMPAMAQSVGVNGDGSGVDNDRLVPGRYPSDPVLASAGGLREPYDPSFNIDWSMALRGSYSTGSSGEQYDVRLVPSVTLEHSGTRMRLNATGSAEIARPSQGQIDISALRLSGTAGYALDSDTTLTAGGQFSLTRTPAGTPGLASNIATAPQTITSGGDLGITRQFGKFNVGLTGSVDRSVYGKTTLTNGTLVDNAEQNAWTLESGLRVGFQLTPIFEVFGKAGIGRDIFDLPSVTLGYKPDATTTTLEAGVTGRWNSILEATASTGVSLRRFDAAGLDEVKTQLYDAQLSFMPDPTLRMTAEFATTVAPPGPNGSGSTRIGYGANAKVAYTANSWLALRALASWSGARFVASPETEKGYGLGAGADYKVNAHTALTADYNYDKSDSTANGAQEAHRVTLGVTLSR